jgi:hypothetical protein
LLAHDYELSRQDGVPPRREVRRQAIASRACLSEQNLMAQVGRVRRDGHSCKTGNQLADQLQAPAGQLRRRETMPVTFPPSLLRLVAKPLATDWLHIATMGTDSWFAVTRHSTAEWLAQQTVEAFPWDTDRPRFLPTKVLA